MPTIIRNLPVDDARAVVYVHERPVAVFAFQAVVWVSIVPVRPQTLDPDTPRFPAVVDLGYNGTFAIREEQLREWAGMAPRLSLKLRIFLIPTRPRAGGSRFGDQTRLIPERALFSPRRSTAASGGGRAARREGAGSCGAPLVPKPGAALRRVLPIVAAAGLVQSGGG